MKKLILILLFVLIPALSSAQIRGVVVKDGVAVNTVMLPQDWTGAVGEWQPPDGSIVVTGKGGASGDDYDGANFIKFVFVNRDANGNITRITGSRKGATQLRIRANHAEVAAYRAVQAEIRMEENIIEARKKLIAECGVFAKLETENVTLKHHVKPATCP